MININEAKILEVNLGGRGGKESLLSEVFSDIKRTDEELFDAIDQDGIKLEFKKQANTQWFDAGKYHNLSEADRSILMTFILTTKASKRKNIEAGLIDKIFTISLGDFLDTLTTSEKHKKDGWELSNIETCYEQKKKYKTQQAKLKVDVRAFLVDNLDKVEMVWER
jgi:hypothetical protein